MIQGVVHTSHQGFVKRPGSYKRSSQLHAQFLRHVSKRFHLWHIFGDASQIFVVEIILGVDNSEHSLVKYAEKSVHTLGKSNGAFFVVELQFVKEVAENVGVFQIDFAVSTFEHLMEFHFRAVHHSSKTIWTKKNKTMR